MDIDQTVSAFRNHPSTSGFVLDFDGTLSRIVEDPEAAAPLPGATDTLDTLARKYGVVALVSGRRAEDLFERVRVGGVRYIGLYGAEELVDGDLLQPEAAEVWRASAARLAEQARAAIETEGLGGCEVEYKDMAVSIHFRRAADPHAAEEEIMTWAQRAVGRRGFMAGRGRMVIELRPVGVSKADAFERVVREAGLQRCLLAGDDATDVEAMVRAEGVPAEVVRVAVVSDESPEGLVASSDIQVGNAEAVVALLGRFA